MRLIYALSALFLAAGCATAPDDTISQREAYDRVAPALMRFAAHEMSVEAAPVPDVEFTNLRGGNLAAYLPGRDLIVLREDWTVNDEGIHDLTHELVHAIQHHNVPMIYDRQLSDAIAIKKGDTRDAWAKIDRIWRICIESEMQAHRIAAGRSPAVARKLATEGCEMYILWRDEFPRD